MNTEHSPYLLRGRLWVGWSLLALLIVTLIAANAAMPRDAAASHHDFGLDFVAFYRAGVLVDTGQSNKLYDLENTRQFDRELAAREQLPLGDKSGPFFNPPLLAWLYAPLTLLGYERAVFAWTLISVGCFIAAAYLLTRMIASTDGRSWGLVPALLATSLPFLQTIGHAQNACLSLLLASVIVTAWRKGHAFVAGIVVGLLGYKPQLAAVIFAALVINLGWRALAGAVAGGGSLLAINIITLPGTLEDYLHRIGPNVQFMMATHPYIWARHATFRAFWQLMLNHGDPARSSMLSISLSLACATIFGIGLLVYVCRYRAISSRDRVIAAVIASAPLLMPYYVDYDLLLLAIPAVLLGKEMLERESLKLQHDRWLVRLWIGLYLLLLINPGLTLSTGINFGVLMLSAIAAISIFRIGSENTVRASESISDGGCSSLRIATPYRALAW